MKPVIIKRVIGRSTWIAKTVGPMARDALDAIGRPSDVEEIRIEQVGDDYTLDGKPVSRADADLVWNAWRCDPKRFSEDASEELVIYMRRAITLRRLLGGTAA
ncbi:hypothetical protein SAMN02799643_03377 [Methylobacterium sp. UNCCL125]|jgi:hypothetical protein|nr:hypothetical protein SAMN02799643_03377 [Methylobacterium sp. UNCCL125]